MPANAPSTLLLEMPQFLSPANGGGSRLTQTGIAWLSQGLLQNFVSDFRMDLATGAEQNELRRVAVLFWGETSCCLSDFLIPHLF
jgi:hypothetical protein